MAVSICGFVCHLFVCHCNVDKWVSKTTSVECARWKLCLKDHHSASFLFGLGGPVQSTSTLLSFCQRLVCKRSAKQIRFWLDLTARRAYNNHLWMGYFPYCRWIVFWAQVILNICVRFLEKLVWTNFYFLATKWWHFVSQVCIALGSLLWFSMLYISWV